MSISVNKHLINACHGSGTVLTMKIWHGSKNSRFDGINKQHSEWRQSTSLQGTGPRMARPQLPSTSTCYSPPSSLLTLASVPFLSTRLFPVMQSWFLTAFRLCPWATLSQKPSLTSSCEWANPSSAPILPPCFPHHPGQLPSPNMLLGLFSFCLFPLLWCKSHDNRAFSLFYSLLPPQWLQQCLAQLGDLCGWLAS